MTDDRWLLLEQPGPWGPKVPHGAGLDEALATELAARCEALGIRLALLRRTVAREHVRRRTAFLACTRRGATLGRAPPLEDPADALRLDLDALGAGRPTDPAARWTRDVFAVCAHGERDPCCARLGRPLHRALLAARPDATWQTSHLGGHRFAPTLLHLPSGVCLGRVPAARAREVAAALEAGPGARSSCCAAGSATRGRSRPPTRSCGPSAGSTGSTTSTVLAVEDDVVTLRADGAPVRVEVEREPLPERPASCGKADEPAGRPVLRAAAPA